MFAGEDSEDDDNYDGEEIQIFNKLDNNNQEQQQQDCTNDSNSQYENNSIESATGILHPLDMLNKSFLDSVMPKLDIADQKLKELSVNQIELSQEMEAQKHKLHRAPALHKAHRIIRQVPKYQKKINNLRKDMKAITTLVEKMKTQSLDLQLRVQEAVLKHQEKNLMQSTNSKQ